MSRFIETIRLENGLLQNLQYHNTRANNTRRAVLGIEEPVDLSESVPISDRLRHGVFRCRVRYDNSVTAVEIEPYIGKEIRTLKLVDGGDIDYRFKYVDRSALLKLYALRGDCDDVLIVKDGLITDTSYANVAFFDGAQWVTPGTPLLAGTKRQELLDTGRLKLANIVPTALKRYTHFTVFNALRGFDEASAIPVSQLLL